MVGALTRTRSRLTLAAAALAGGLVCGLGAVWSFDHQRAALLAALIIVIPLPFVVRAWQRRWDPFEPINLMVIGLVVLFIARPLAELGLNLHPYDQLYNERLGFNTALLIGLVGTVAMYVGYFSRVGTKLANRLRPLPDEWDARRSVRFAVWLLVIGAILSLGYAAQIGFHNFVSLYQGRSSTQHIIQDRASAYFEQGPYLTIPASFILLIAWFRRRTLGTTVLLVLTMGLAILVTVPRGDRTFILELVLPLVALPYLRRMRRPRVVTILIAFVVFVFAINIEVALRNKESRPGQSAIGVIDNAVTHPGHQFRKFIDGADPSEFSVLAVEAHQYAVGQLKHQQGGTIRNILIGWIPHQFLKKPLTPLQYVSWTLFPATSGAGSFGPPMFGSMYADDGWLAVVVLSLLVGVGLRALWQYFRRASTSAGMQMVFAASLPMVVILLRDDIDDIFYRSVFVVLPVILCVIICSRPPKRVRALVARLAELRRAQRLRTSGAIPSRSAVP